MPRRLKVRTGRLRRRGSTPPIVKRLVAHPSPVPSPLPPSRDWLRRPHSASRDIKREASATPHPPPQNNTPSPTCSPIAAVYHPNGQCWRGTHSHTNDWADHPSSPSSSLATIISPVVDQSLLVITSRLSEYPYFYYSSRRNCSRPRVACSISQSVLLTRGQ